MPSCDESTKSHSRNKSLPSGSTGELHVAYSERRNRRKMRTSQVDHLPTGLLISAWRQTGSPTALRGCCFLRTPGPLLPFISSWHTVTLTLPRLTSCEFTIHTGYFSSPLASANLELLPSDLPVLRSASAMPSQLMRQTLSSPISSLTPFSHLSTSLPLGIQLPQPPAPKPYNHYLD